MKMKLCTVLIAICDEDEDLCVLITICDENEALYVLTAICNENEYFLRFDCCLR